MFELSSETKISELRVESEEMMAALTKTGIFRNGDDPEVTIGDLCWSYGLNPLIILNSIALARAEAGPDVDISELDGLTLTQVVQNIETAHHEYLRKTMPELTPLIERVVHAHGAGDERLIEIRELFDKMSADLENHMLHEEESLFPMVRDMEAGGKIQPTRCGNAVGGPIACMENEHKATQAELVRLRELTDDFAAPDFACMTYRKMLELLQEFEQDMLVHIAKEDRVLFPGALQAQRVLRATNRGDDLDS